MKTVKKSGIGILLLLLCTFCTEYPKDYEPVHRQAFSRYTYLSVDAEVSEIENTSKFLDNHSIEFFGNVASCNLSQSNAPCITVNGIITEPDAKGNFRFEEGELLLESTTTDCKLWGQFSGMGSLTGHQFTIDCDVEVDCGTGLFKSKSGQLQLIITGLLPTEDQSVSTYDLALKGRIKK